jgi:hypothetical protein
MSTCDEITRSLSYWRQPVQAELVSMLGAPQRSIVRQLKARAAQLEIQEEVEEYARARNQPLFGRFA